jgi:fluoride ion exporter CrcB/FEX
VEADLLVSHGRPGLALGYIAGSLTGGVAAVYLGIALARRRPGGERR